MKWEYHIEDIWRAKKFDYINDRLTKLGEDGWELVESIERDPTGNDPSMYLIFKRPKPK